ncbi:MAG: peptidase family protein [Acidimicrobiales bacterium]|nr:peptidase family protein [Acidimicrobiales bacterium]
MPEPRRTRTANVIAALVLVSTITACSSDAAPASSGSNASRWVERPDTAGAFRWTTIGEGLQGGHLTVPIDRAHPDTGSFSLVVERHLATDSKERIGSLLVNPGGPGYGGTDLAESAEQIYGKDVLAHFDIVAWDPRGTGKSSPDVDCIDDYDRYFGVDSSPDDATEREAILADARKFGAECETRSGAILPFVSTADSARDMDAIRAALQEPRISYFGFSYGSELGVAWAGLFPKTVRAMVIDGSIDGTVDHLLQSLDQAAGFESTFDAFLADCAKRSSCAFHNGGDPGAAYDALNRAAESDPVPSGDGRPAINQGILASAVADAMYSTDTWPDLENALADLQHGDGAGALALYDDYYERMPNGAYDNSYEAYFAINCLDDPGTKDPQAVFAMQDDFAKVAPRLGTSWLLELEFCAEWPVPAGPPVPDDAKGAGPIVVVGTTGDPATPLAGTRKQAEALEEGHLIVVTADQHTGYGVNDCVDSAVDDYLVELTVPANELQCR